MTGVREIEPFVNQFSIDLFRMNGSAIKLVESDKELRESVRFNTMLAAIASVGTNSWAVKIKNLSSRGAMIETNIRPEVKSSIVLKRGCHFAAGEVVWNRPQGIGIRFFELIDVAEWRGTSSNDGTTVAENVRTPPLVAIPELCTEEVVQRVAEEIAYVERVITATSAVLSEDPILRVRHCRQIQELSMAAEQLQGLIAVIRSDDKIAAIQNCTSGPMRQRLLRDRAKSISAIQAPSPPDLDRGVDASTAFPSASDADTE